MAVPRARTARRISTQLTLAPGLAPPPALAPISGRGTFLAGSATADGVESVEAAAGACVPGDLPRGPGGPGFAGGADESMVGISSSSVESGIVAEEGAPFAVCGTSALICFPPGGCPGGPPGGLAPPAPAGLGGKLSRTVCLAPPPPPAAGFGGICSRTVCLAPAAPAGAPPGGEPPAAGLGGSDRRTVCLAGAAPPAGGGAAAGGAAGASGAAPVGAPTFAGVRGGKVNRTVSFAVGLGGRLIRTVSFFG